MRLKILLLFICSIIASISGLISYEIKKQKLTPWQQVQEIDFQKQTGSTKFQAIIDSFTNGALAFGISAIVIASGYKFYKSNKK